MFIPGDQDLRVHIDGGVVGPGHGHSVSLAEASSFWRNWDRTSSVPGTQELPDQADDGTRVRRETYGGGKQGTEVVVYTIAGGGAYLAGRAAVSAQVF
jgi:poly(3-hydroxybutyrate) depolymerase